MSTVGAHRHKFEMDSYVIAEAVQEAALRKAREIKKSYDDRNKVMPNVKIIMNTRTICREAFKNFENVLKERFPSDDDSLDIKIRLMMKETQFLQPEKCCDRRSSPSLVTRVKNILLGQDGIGEAEQKKESDEAS